MNAYPGIMLPTLRIPAELIVKLPWVIIHGKINKESIDANAWFCYNINTGESTELFGTYEEALNEVTSKQEPEQNDNSNFRHGEYNPSER